MRFSNELAESIQFSRIGKILKISYPVGHKLVES